MLDADNTKPAAPVRKREERPERPKHNPKEDLDYRINGLEEAKQDPDMSKHDVAALERSIAKLRQKKAEKEPKPASQTEEQF